MTIPKPNLHREMLKLRRRHFQTAAQDSAMAHTCCGEDADGHHHHHHTPHMATHHAEAMAEAEKMIEKLRDQLSRQQAEFENARRRQQRDQQQQLEFANQRLIESLLPVVDNFGRALANPGDTVEGLLSGLQMVQRQFIDILAQQGLEPVPSLGETFNPNLHEAVSMAPDEGTPDNQVLEVFQEGYQLKGRLIRPAMVKVAKN